MKNIKIKSHSHIQNFSFDIFYHLLQFTFLSSCRCFNPIPGGRGMQICITLYILFDTVAQACSLLKLLTFTESQYSFSFKSYRISKFAILVGSLIKKRTKLTFCDISRQTYQHLQFLSKLAEICTR